MKITDDASDKDDSAGVQTAASAAGPIAHPESNADGPDVGDGSPEGAGSPSEPTQTRLSPKESGSDLGASAAGLAEQRGEEVVEAAAVSAEAAAQVVDAAETAADATAKAKGEAQAAAPCSSSEGILALGVALAVVFAAVVSAVLGPNMFGTGSDVGRGNNSASMSIVAATVRDLPEVEQGFTQPVDQIWRIRGQVLFENNPADGAIVYAVLRDQWGNEYTSDLVKSTTAAGFSINLHLGKHEELLRPRAEEVLVVASLTRQVEGWFFSGDSSHRASAELRPEPSSGSRWSRKSAAPFMSALVIFGFSILVSMVPVSGRVWQASKYLSVALLGVIFTTWMIYFISVTMQTLGGSSKSDEVISLGFAHVFYGGYVEDADDEWILSLTTPEVRADNLEQSMQSVTFVDAAPAAAKPAIAFQTSGGSTAIDVPDQALDSARGPVREIETLPSFTEETVQSGRKVNSGFGAPLWLLLLSVVGASAFAIRMVLENLEKPGAFIDSEVRSKVAAILRHQFYILFAPLGAVFVYQLLVAAGSASEPITVGLAALASGVALSSVLERASQAVETVTGRERRASTPSEAGRGE